MEFLDGADALLETQVSGKDAVFNLSESSENFGLENVDGVMSKTYSASSSVEAEVTFEVTINPNILITGNTLSKIRMKDKDGRVFSLITLDTPLTLDDGNTYEILSVW